MAHFSHTFSIPCPIPRYYRSNLAYIPFYNLNPQKCVLKITHIARPSSPSALALVRVLRCRIAPTAN